MQVPEQGGGDSWQSGIPRPDQSGIPRPDLAPSTDSEVCLPFRSIHLAFATVTAAFGLYACIAAGTPQALFPEIIERGRGRAVARRPDGTASLLSFPAGSRCVAAITCGRTEWCRAMNLSGLWAHAVTHITIHRDIRVSETGKSARGCRRTVRCRR